MGMNVDPEETSYSPSHIVQITDFLEFLSEYYKE